MKNAARKFLCLTLIASALGTPFNFGEASPVPAGWSPTVFGPGDLRHPYEDPSDSNAKAIEEHLSLPPSLEKPPSPAATEDTLDQLLGPALSLDMSGILSPHVARRELLRYLGVYDRNFHSSAYERLQTLIARIQNPQDGGAPREYKMLMYWTHQFWLYSSAKVRLQPKSRWTPQTTFMLRRSLAEVAGAVRETQLNPQKKIELLTFILAQSPAFQSHPQEYVRELDYIDEQTLSLFNYEQRNRAALAVPLPDLKTNYFVLAPIAAGALLGASLLGPAGFFLGMMGAAPVMAIAGAKGAEARQQALNARKEAVAAVFALEKEAWDLASPAILETRNACFEMFSGQKQ